MRNVFFTLAVLGTVATVSAFSKVEAADRMTPAGSAARLVAATTPTAPTGDGLRIEPVRYWHPYYYGRPRYYYRPYYGYGYGYGYYPRPYYGYRYSYRPYYAPYGGFYYGGAPGVYFYGY